MAVAHLSGGKAAFDAVGIEPIRAEVASPKAPAAMPAGSAVTGSTRPFDRADVPAVSRLFLDTFRRGHRTSVAELESSVAALYLTAPASTPATGSIVHVDARSRVDGFMGIINMSLKIGQRSLRAGVMSAYMADKQAADPNIGVQLARAIVAAPLDVLFTDTANDTSLDMSRAMRFGVVPVQSLEWTKVLRPAGTGGYVLSRRAPRLSRPIGAIAAAADALIPTRAAPDVNPRTVDATTDRAIDVGDFVAQAPTFVEPFLLRPAWDRDELSWLMAQAALRTKDGPLHIREVLDRRGKAAGLYLLYARPGGIAYALQVLARPGREDIVVGNLIAQAKRLGAVAIRGQASAPVVSGLLRQKGVFYRHLMNLIVRSADPDVLQAVRTGDLCLGGLAGETWARIFGDEFQ